MPVNTLDVPYNTAQALQLLSALPVNIAALPTGTAGGAAVAGGILHTDF
jgi:hypothetical protein